MTSEYLKIFYHASLSHGARLHSSAQTPFTHALHANPFSAGVSALVCSKAVPIATFNKAYVLLRKTNRLLMRYYSRERLPFSRAVSLRAQCSLSGEDCPCRSVPGTA
jgi:hypothetical protein